jgi:hypothetical protein
MLDSVVAKQIQSLESEIDGLETEANQLADRIEQVTGKAGPAWNL